MAKPGRSLPEVKRTIPEELHSVLDDLVADYRASSLAIVGKDLVSYAILAGLIRKGWRKTEEESS